MATNLKDSSGHHLEDDSHSSGVPRYIISAGTTVPTAGSSGYSAGAVFIQIDGGTGSAIYVNEGSSVSCIFNPVIMGTTCGSEGRYFDEDSSIRIDATINAFGASETVLFDLKQATVKTVVDHSVNTENLAYAIPIMVDGDTSTVKYLALYNAD